MLPSTDSPNGALLPRAIMRCEQMGSVESCSKLDMQFKADLIEFDLKEGLVPRFTLWLDKKL